MVYVAKFITDVTLCISRLQIESKGQLFGALL